MTPIFDDPAGALARFRGGAMPREVGIARYLVVARETVTNPELLAQANTVVNDDRQAGFVLLVPPPRPGTLVFRRGKEDEAQLVARKLADNGVGDVHREGHQPRLRRLRHLYPAEGDLPMAADEPATHGRVEVRPAGVSRAGGARLDGQRPPLTTGPPPLRGRMPRDMRRNGRVA